MRIYQTTSLVVPDGSGPRPVRSVAWRWDESADVAIPIAMVTQDGAAVDLATISSCSLAFWASTLDDSPTLEVALVQTEPEAEDDPVNLGTFTLEAGDLEAGQYAVGAKVVIDGTTDTVLVFGRVEVTKRAA